MHFDEQNIAAIQSLGYTAEEARFLYLVAVHSGYFVPRQFLTFSGVKWERRANLFTAKLLSRGHVTWREYDGTGGVYHLLSRTLYRRIGRDNLRKQRPHSIEFIRTRLVLLDFILANLGYDYLETEADKVHFFCETLGVPKKALPAKRYQGDPKSEPTLHYFVDRFPMFLDPTGFAPVVTLSYVDGGQVNLAGFQTHLRAYLPLLGQLHDFSFLYIASSLMHFAGAEKRFRSLVRLPLEAEASGEILRYFELRNAWELKKYGSLSASDVEWLKEALGRFQTDRLEACYHAWASGQWTEEALRAELVRLRPHSKVWFGTYLVADRSLEKSRAAGGHEPLPLVSS